MKVKRQEKIDMKNLRERRQNDCDLPQIAFANYVANWAFLRLVAMPTGPKGGS